MTSTPPLPPVWETTPTAPGAPAAVAYGGFWIRVVAYVIDIVLLDVVFGIVGALAGIHFLPSDERMATSVDAVLIAMPFKLMALVLSWLYFALMESSERGATVGKMAMGLRVVTDQGQRLSFLNATGRYFAKFISTIILFVGFIMVAFTERKRGLHDMIAGTLVIKTR